MKKIAVVTGTRAEYGLLKGVIAELLTKKDIAVQLVVTGSHLRDGTVKDIEADGFDIACRVEILKFGTSTEGVASTAAYTSQVFTDCFLQLKPDGLLVLGDRYEIFAVAGAARFLNIPIFHISGGDVTSGAIDDCLRHCITKLSSVHFPSCEQYAQRLLRLGEQPDSVYNVGGLGDENIRNMTFMTRKELSQSLGFNVCREFVLVTYHPETLSTLTPTQQTDMLLRALSSYSGAVIITGANSDAGGDEVNALLKAFCEAREDRFFIMSMGLNRYLSAMSHAAAVVGNSSSGVCETPTFGVPTVNIGNRQNGRLMAQNILCCRCDDTEIERALHTVSSEQFCTKSRAATSPYNGGNTAKRIADITAQLLLQGIKGEKVFYDAT